ncbi:glycosyltransferase [Oceaniovalibus sp. ACAM 378]|uniref:glycosyltransferase n=1 Tax=Oceaniovalibus sp. ACAM 378 TaxID=2599923 RepID=UPI0011D8F1EA|nr:glycosyltransferase [Oceaniovalibus sp. ACAM 378]TYB88616.1 glycosyltransferase [Oceaniovalibus sp. ACAM 378]
MNILFLHQNFPGQFKHLAPALAARSHRVTALTSRVEKAQMWNGVQIVPYGWKDPEAQVHHPWLTNLNGAMHRGAAVYRAAEVLASRGYSPDMVIAHTGWGESLFVQDVWPDAKVGVFSEFHYQPAGADIGFDPEFATIGAFGEAARMRMRNLSMRMQLERAHMALSPTAWQAGTHPPELRDKITVVHDGIDTETAKPDPAARLAIDGLTLTRDDEVITFVNRNLEPYRGFHVFMRALPELLRRRPNAQVVIVGGDAISYGTAPSGGGTWKEKMLGEVRGQISDADWARVHFVGKLPYSDFLSLLRVSTVHVYLTYPFVLSWSLMESMAIECAIVASNTAPVAEVITDGETGLLFDFFDGAAMVDQIESLCRDPALRARLGAAARARILADYDLRTVCLPRQFDWVERLALA